MPESEFLCLAVSRHLRGHYAAGIDLATGEWVRLVGNQYGSELGLFEPKVYVEGTPRLMKPLDVVSLELEAHVPKLYQPHNWILASTTPESHITLLRNAAEDETLNKVIRGLEKMSRNEDLLFGSETSEITSEITGLRTSLLVTQPERLYWRKTDEFSKGRGYGFFGEGPRIKGEFGFGGLPYGLPLGAVAWGNRIRGYLPEKGSLEHQLLLERIDPTLHVDTFLTLSFDDDIVLDRGRYNRYKFIAGVLLLPKQKQTDGALDNSAIRYEA